jgi:hypothetical protein
VLKPVENDVGMRGARNQQLRRQSVNLCIAIVANDQPLIRIEHAETLGNIVHRGAQANVLKPQLFFALLEHAALFVLLGNVLMRYRPADAGHMPMSKPYRPITDECLVENAGRDSREIVVREFLGGFPAAMSARHADLASLNDVHSLLEAAHRKNRRSRDSVPQEKTPVFAPQRKPMQQPVQGRVEKTLNLAVVINGAHFTGVHSPRSSPPRGHTHAAQREI